MSKTRTSIPSKRHVSIHNGEFQCDAVSGFRSLELIWIGHSKIVVNQLPSWLTDLPLQTRSCGFEPTFDSRTFSIISFNSWRLGLRSRLAALAKAQASRSLASVGDSSQGLL